MLNYKHYRKNPVIDYPEREWPNKEIEKAPIWCSVDLRDGNQALIDPMVVSEKIEFFNYLVKLGFKEIEIGFPAASQIEFDFLRQLIDRKMIPDDVVVQVLTQCREELVARTFESIQGCKQAIVHIYNSTSTLQRDVVFHMDREQIINIAVEGTRMVKHYAKDFPGKIILEYSPESFTGTELDFALDICTAVQDEWKPTKENPMIINLPSTVEMNMFSQGIDPKLAIEHVNESIEIYERCCKIPIHPRHPYAGKLVFTAFSGSHQDAINKGVQALRERGGDIWQVPYLPIDPADIGREYEPIVRINSQSGKGGVAFIMDTYFGFKLPKGMHREFADVIQSISEKQGEVSPDQIMENFRREYLDQKEPIHFRKLRVDDLSGETDSEFDTKVLVTYTNAGVEKNFEAVGNGPIDAVKRGLQVELGIDIKILDYEEHALQSGSNSQAAAYIHLLDVESGKVTYGVGVSSNITRASVRAIFSAINRLGLGQNR